MDPAILSDSYLDPAPTKYPTVTAWVCGIEVVITLRPLSSLVFLYSAALGSLFETAIVFANLAFVILYFFL